MVARDKVVGLAVQGLEGFVDLSELRTLVFSDTILVMLPVPADEPPAWQALRWSMFLLVVGKIYADLFRFGLPIRGAISLGDIVLHNMCFAGKAIVEAYQLAQDIDAALCVLTPQAAHRLNGACKILRESPIEALYPHSDGMAGHEDEARIICDQLARILEYQAPEYSIPRKSGADERLSFVSSFHKEDDIASTNDDLLQVVLDSFSRHKKKLSPDVVRKAQNTAEGLRYLIHRRERNSSNGEGADPSK